MKKVHPSLTSVQSDLRQMNNQESRREEAEVLTVWRKSLLFNCSGFTVFDAKGNLVFRVDNYGSDCKSEVVLMDATGKPLFSIRKKVFKELIYSNTFLPALKRNVVFLKLLKFNKTIREF